MCCAGGQRVVEVVVVVVVGKASSGLPNTGAAFALQQQIKLKIKLRINTGNLIIDFCIFIALTSLPEINTSLSFRLTFIHVFQQAFNEGYAMQTGG